MDRRLMPVATFAVGILLGGSAAAPAVSDPQPQMPLVTGIGGVFVKAEDPAALRDWYGRHLGMEAGPYGYDFRWRDVGDPDRVGRTVWGIFPRGTDYFGSPDQQLMVNYRVADLDLVLSHLAERGVLPVKPTEEYPYGRFAWVEDGEGNRIELWEPPAVEDP